MIKYRNNRVMAALSSDNSLHKIYTSDPLAFKQYVNQKVMITTLDLHVHTGLVYTVDPVSESFVLMQPKDKEGHKEGSMKIILGPSIKSIDCSFDAQVLLPDMFAAPRIHLTQQELDRRKDDVTKLLLENRFPVTDEKGILCIEDAVKIEPPYQSENCICSNSVILNRIQTLLTRIQI